MGLTPQLQNGWDFLKQSLLAIVHFAGWQFILMASLSSQGLTISMEEGYVLALYQFLLLRSTGSSALIAILLVCMTILVHI